MENKLDWAKEDRSALVYLDVYDSKYDRIEILLYASLLLIGTIIFFLNIFGEMI